MTLRNSRPLGVRNGIIGTAVDVDVVARELRLRTDDGALRVPPAAYLDAGFVGHAYALTVHKAQGLTVDRALLLGSDEL